MKKFLTIGGVVVAVAAAGWSGLWFAGKGEVERRVAAETEKLEARGWTVTWGEKDVSGFPFGYQMKMTDVAATWRDHGVLVRMGDVTASADASNPDRIVADLPPEISLIVPIKGHVRVANPSLPETMMVQIESQGLSMAAEGLDPLSRTVDVIADTLKVTIDQEDFAWKLSSTFEALTANAQARPEGQLLTYQAKRHVTEMRNPQETKAPGQTFDYTDPSMTLEIGAHTPDDFIAQLQQNAADLLNGTFLGSAQTITFTITEPGAAEPNYLTYTAKGNSGVFGLSKGEATYQAEDREVAIAFDVPTAGKSGKTTAALEVEAYQRTLKAPIGARDAPEPGALRLAVIGAELDEAGWKAFDAGNALARGPAELVVDMLGTVRYIPSNAGAGGLPLEFSNVTVNQFKLNALGASADMSGDVEILQPLNLPYGALTVNMTGTQGLLDSLTKAGLLNSQYQQMATAILQVYAKPGEAEDTWTTDITFDHEGPKINGLKLPQ